MNMLKNTADVRARVEDKDAAGRDLTVHHTGGIDDHWVTARGTVTQPRQLPNVCGTPGPPIGQFRLTAVRKRS